MPFKKFLFCCLLGLGSLGFSQEIKLSPAATISVITCGSGEELYSSFGHSALRIADPVLGIDVVYNYGTFNFNAPNFYLKFTQGKLLYSLSRQQFDNFLYEYELENRWVKEQVLALSEVQKNALFLFLENNYRPENRDYKYDFFFDNCSTKMGTVLEQTFGNALQYDYTNLKHQYTFRELIHQNLKTNSWSAFGIDLALGSVIDRKATPHEHLFLPNYVMRQLNHTTLGNLPIVAQERTVLKEGPEPKSNFILSPLFWLSVVLVLVALVTYFDYKNKTRNRWLDFSLFFATGAAGLVIAFLWFFTEHSTTVINFNILWAFPLNLVVAFLLLWKEPKGKGLFYYMLLLLVMSAAILLLWGLKIQVFSPLLLILLIALDMRYLFLHFNLKKGIA